MARYETKKRSAKDLADAAWRRRKGDYGIWDNVKEVWVINYMFTSESHCKRMAKILNKRFERLVEERRFKGKGSDFK